MKKNNSTAISIAFIALAALLALAFTSLVLVMVGAHPTNAYKAIFNGVFSSPKKTSIMISSWIPLLLTSSGVLISFAAGLWNIGIEGQIGMGAIFTTGAIKLLMNTSVPPWLVIVISLLAGMIGGGLWSILAGLLRTYGGVNEIFGGLGLNFVTQALTVWLIFGPWKRPGIGSMSGTEQFPNQYWLPTVPKLSMSYWSIGMGVAAVIFVYLLLQKTYFGLKIKAVGRNRKASELFGIPSARYLLLSFFISGALGGLAGAIEVVEVCHRLIPSISSGFGYSGLMIGMLVNYNCIWMVPVSFLFACLSIGSVQLPIILKLDSSLGGVIQGFLVLFVLLLSKAKNAIFDKKKI